jgi:hypothetical protein
MHSPTFEQMNSMTNQELKAWLEYCQAQYNKVAKRLASQGKK